MMAVLAVALAGLAYVMMFSAMALSAHYPTVSVLLGFFAGILLASVWGAWR